MRPVFLFLVITLQIWLFACGNKTASLPSAEVMAKKCLIEANQWWDTRFGTGLCRKKPKNNGECTALGGFWDPGTGCCDFYTMPAVCPK